MGNVYGNNGNRWWVGLNIGSDQSTIFGTNSLLSPVGYESLPSGNAKDDAQFAAAAKKDAASPKSPVTISVENVSWFNIRGPYPSQKAANAALPAIAKANPAPGELSQLLDTATGQPQSSNSATGLNAIGAFFGDLSEKNTWVRVAKVVVGSVMIIVGLTKLTGTDKAVATAAKDAAKAGPLL